jgi:hypothetical protein
MDHELPLVAMMDFLDDVSVESEVLYGVARVKSFMLTPESPLPNEVHVPGVAITSFR